MIPSWNSWVYLKHFFSKQVDRFLLFLIPGADRRTVSLADHLSPVLGQELGQNSLNFPLDLAVQVGVAECADEKVHVQTVGQVAQFVQLTDDEVLQVGHLKHVGRQVNSFQNLDIVRFHPTLVNVAQHLLEDVWLNALYLHVLRIESKFRFKCAITIINYYFTVLLCTYLA